MTGIKKILVPTDFSELSLEAIDHAIAFAKQLGAEVHILHVCPMLMYALGPDMVPDDPNFELQLKARLTEKLEKVAQGLRARSVHVATLLVTGNPSHEIANVAAERGFDMIVIGTHGRTGLSRFALGSVAERTVRVSKVPVLTVRVADATHATSV
jgi:nucleotide-binding universal stress UspA family protein